MVNVKLTNCKATHGPKKRGLLFKSIRYFVFDKDSHEDTSLEF